MYYGLEYPLTHGVQDHLPLVFFSFGLYTVFTEWVELTRNYLPKALVHGSHKQ